VVLSGQGRAFCAGIDTGRFEGGTRRKSTHAPRTRGIANDSQYVVWAWRELPVPVIAAVHGVAFGAGFQLMLGADMRYIAPGTKLSIMETKWGLVPDTPRRWPRRARSPGAARPRCAPPSAC
jgi:enoyl-CoA hydratase/carnithine racemase